MYVTDEELLCFLKENKEKLGITINTESKYKGFKLFNLLYRRPSSKAFYDEATKITEEEVLKFLSDNVDKLGTDIVQQKTRYRGLRLSALFKRLPLSYAYYEKHKKYYVSKDEELLAYLKANLGNFGPAAEISFHSKYKGSLIGNLIKKCPKAYEYYKQNAVTLDITDEEVLEFLKKNVDKIPSFDIEVTRYKGHKLRHLFRCRPQSKKFYSENKFITDEDLLEYFKKNEKDLGQKINTHSIYKGQQLSSLLYTGTRPKAQAFYIEKANYYFSKPEMAIKEFLNSLGLQEKVDYFTNFRFDFIGQDRDVDFWIPKHNLAIEYNGIYYHCSKFRKDRRYHISKTDACANKGITLLHVWNTCSFDFLFSKLKTLLGHQKGMDRYYARQTYVAEISNSIAQDFYRKNHNLKGCSFSSFLHLGLFSQKTKELLSAVSFTTDGSRVINTRYCVKNNTVVVGGAQKLFKYAFSKVKEKGFETVVTYIDRDFSPIYENTVYYKLGFKKVSTQLNLKYFVSRGIRNSEGKLIFRANELYPRNIFMKHKLEKVFKDVPGFVFDEKKTEKENLESLYIYQVWNAGTDTVVLELV